MSFAVERLRCIASDDDMVYFDTIVSTLKASSLHQVIDLACLDDEDIATVFPDCNVAGAVSRLRDHAVSYRGGWASLSALQYRAEKSSAPVSAPTSEAARFACESSFRAKPPRQAPKTSARVLNAACGAFARRFVLGAKACTKAKHKSTRSLAEVKKADMDKALLKVHNVFSSFAQGSPRFIGIRQGPDVMMEMQMQAYRMRSRASQVVAQRARASENFFLDFAAFG